MFCFVFEQSLVAKFGFDITENVPSKVWGTPIVLLNNPARLSNSKRKKTLTNFEKNHH